MCPRLTLVLLVQLGWFAPALHAQADSVTVVISGTIIDPLRKPIEGAEVQVVGGAAPVFSTSEGKFRLVAPRSRSLLVRVRRPGYNAVLLQFDGNWDGTVLLEPGSFKLPDVQVTARYAKPARFAGTSKYDDYFRRRRQGLGQFIDREEIERRPSLHTYEILEGRAGIKALPPGIDNSPPLVAFARCNEYPPKINVYVDGLKLIPDNPREAMKTVSPLMLGRVSRSPEIAGMVGEMLGRINPRDIEFMEIFRGAGELPPEFNDGNCGAIVIWTRQGSQ